VELSDFLTIVTAAAAKDFSHSSAETFRGLRRESRAHVPKVRSASRSYEGIYSDYFLRNRKFTTLISVDQEILQRHVNFLSHHTHHSNRFRPHSEVSTIIPPPPPFLPSAPTAMECGHSKTSC
jgi:hypothetical protein